MTIKLPRIISTVRAATLFDEPPIIGDTGCDACVRQSKFSLIPSQLEAGIESIGRSVTARKAVENDVPESLRPAVARADAILEDVKVATLDDIPLLSEAFRNAFRTDETNATSFITAIFKMSVEHPDKDLRGIAYSKFEDIASYGSEIFYVLFFNNIPATCNRKVLWNRLRGMLAREGGERDHIMIGLTVAMLYEQAQQTQSLETLKRLIYHDNPCVRRYCARHIIDMREERELLQHLWGVQRPMIERDIALFDKKRTFAGDAIILLMDFVEDGVEEAMLMMSNIMENHDDPWVRTFAHFVFTCKDEPNFDDSGV